MSAFVNKLLSALRSDRAGSLRRRASLTLEPLEDRTVPTVVFQPWFGPETVLTRGTEHLSNSPVHLIFWGSQWNTDTSPAALAIKNAANRVLTSTYFSDLQQYGVTGGPHLDISTYDNNNPGNFSDKTIVATVSNATHNSLPRADTGDTGSNRRIYVVVTPPGATSASAGPSTLGWNSSFADPFPGFPQKHYVSTPIIWCSTSGNINNFTGPDLDYFTSTFSHELAEIMTDPYGNGVHVSVPKPFVGDQIGDGEAAGLNYGYRLNGALVQPYWSDADKAFIVPDGRPNQRIELIPLWVPLFTGTTFTFQYTNTNVLVIRDYITHLTLDVSPAGGVQVDLNGEFAQFEPGQILSVDVTTLGSRDTIDVEAALSNVPIQISLGSGEDTVILGEFGHQLDRVRGSVSVTGGHGKDTLRLDDSQGFDVLTDYTITSGGVTRTALTPFGSTVRASISYSNVGAIELDGGHGVNFFAVQSTPAGSFTLKTGVAPLNSIVVGDVNHTLNGIHGALSLIGGGGVDLLQIDDSLSYNIPVTYTVTSGGLSRAGVALVNGTPAAVNTSIRFSNIGNIELDGGIVLNFYDIQGTPGGEFTVKTNTAPLNSIVVGDVNHTLNGIHGILRVVGSGGSDVLRLNDSQSYNIPVTYTITSGGVDRAGLALVAGMPTAANASIRFSGVGSVELDGGIAVNTFAVLSLPSAPMTLVGGPGVNTLDYSGYAGDIVVNLRLGTATGFAGISGVQNVTGSQGNDVLVGDAGANVLRGGTGRNLIVGGGGADQVFGGGGDSILIGGTTAYDADPAALNAIMAEWVRADLTYDERVAELSSGDFPTPLTADTVFANPASSLTNGLGQDWLFA